VVLHNDENAEELRMIRMMWLIREFELAVTSLVDRGLIRGTTHLSIGQEATIVGSCAALEPRDYMFGNHRSHGHPIAKGASPRGLMAEILGRDSGVCRGLGGSMHLTDVSVGAMGELAIVGQGLPLAVGAGLSCDAEGSGRVALCFFGDGATTTGSFHESLNLASLWCLPVVFVCENNLYAVTTPLAQASAEVDLTKKADAYAMRSSAVDGQDVSAVHATVRAAVENARGGGGPSFVEARTYRFVEHGRMKISHLYRTESEIKDWEEKDPITLFEARLRAAGIEPAVLEGIRTECIAEVHDAVESALGDTVLESDIAEFMYAD
jgi:TPP-dependent pyruvate/acetoin dehydrogenase alpha subunit